METSAIGASAGKVSAASGSFGQMKSEDFFALLVSELRNQDPFQPSETSDMISQVSQIRSIELSDQLTSTLETMTDSQRNLGSADMIGKYVEGVVTEGDSGPRVVGGVVTGVVLAANGEVVLELDSGQRITAEQVQLITTPQQAEAWMAAGGSDDKAQSAAKARKQPHWFDLVAKLQL